MNKWTKKCLSALLSVVLLIQGCTAQKKRISYTVYPIGYLLEYIGGSTFDSVSIQTDMFVQKSTIEDGYLDEISDSDVFMYIGELEPYLTVTGSDIKETGVTTLDLSAMNAIYDFRRYTSETTSTGTYFNESDWYEGSVFSKVDMYEKDVSLWMDPVAMLSMGKSIYDWLCDNYGENSDYYTTRYNLLESDLVNLDAQFQVLATSLSNSEKTIRFVSMTPSFGNWQKAYGFEVYPVILSKYGVLPNEEQIQEIEERIIEDEVKYIAYEENLDDETYALYERIKNDCDLQSFTLSNLSSLTEEQVLEGKDYLSIMYENLTALQTISSSDDEEEVSEEIIETED